jgi:hypothetical protein
VGSERHSVPFSLSLSCYLLLCIASLCIDVLNDFFLCSFIMAELALFLWHCQFQKCLMESLSFLMGTEL